MIARSTFHKVIPFLKPVKKYRVDFSSLADNRGMSVVTAGSRRGFSALEELQRERLAEESGLSTSIIDKIEYERPLKIVSYPDPKLRLPNAKIRLPAEGIDQLAKDMFEIMYMDDGVGLAAPQVGVNVQMMVFNEDGPPGRGDKSKEVVLINPKIIKMSKDTEVDVEGCLSFYQPVYIKGDVERSSSIKIKAQDPSGAKLTMVLKGLPARIFQHEYDHLQGTLFFERMSSEVLSTVRADLIRYEEEFMKKNPNVQIQRIKQT